MTILEKLGIDRKTVYDNLAKGNRSLVNHSITWHYWKFYVWPTYSEILENLIKTTRLLDLNTFDEDIHERGGNQRTENIEIIEKATGLTWKQINEFLIKKIKVKRGQLPEWAEYVVKHEYGDVWIYKEKPYISNYLEDFTGVPPNEEVNNIKIKGPWKDSLRKIEIVEGGV